ncbi:MAG: hypothetical protein JNK48_34480 [Bryobacterales bacterium]|nr:hypothetical protein [Bryobacterales bacterium]
MTLEEFFGGKAGVYPGYAPAEDSNQPLLYAQNVSSWTNIPLGVPLSHAATPEFAFYDDPLGDSGSDFPVGALVLIVGIAVALSL